eukprot:evm.model.scf_128EXC.12 EVM.evm.TU.scf_128EXC.12   scf_128EXC:98252-99040(-)
MEIRPFREGDEAAVRRLFLGSMMDTVHGFVHVTWPSMLPTACSLALAVAAPAAAFAWPRFGPSTGASPYGTPSFIFRWLLLSTPLAAAYYPLARGAVRHGMWHYVEESMRGDLADISGHYRESLGKGFWVAVIEGEVVGTVALDVWGGEGRQAGGKPIGELRRLAVSQECRGRGTGAALTRHVLSEARRMGYSEVRLTTSTGVYKARRLYDKLGFRLLRDPVPVLGTGPAPGWFSWVLGYLGGVRFMHVYDYGIDLEDLPAK